MAMILRYSGEFYGQRGSLWRCEIWQDGWAGEVGELTFPAEEPLTVCWEESSKEDVLCGSSATLTIESPGDRTYIDLYTVEPGRIRLDVYCDEVLWWSGALDAEFYEEPYERARQYDVSLTFSDFGILDRLRWQKSAGLVTVRDVVDEAVERAGLSLIGDGVRPDYISTETTAGGGVFDGVAVRADNFFDEEDEAMTLAEVVEAVLQPLGLRMIQRDGQVWVYDIHNLVTDAETLPVRWSADAQTLSVDKVANAVEITFSPYSDATLLDGEMEYNAKTSAAKKNLTNTPLTCYQDDDSSVWEEVDAEEYEGQGYQVDGKYYYITEGDWGEYYSYYPAMGSSNQVNGQWDYDNVDFTIFLHRSKADGIAAIGDGMRYFHIQPVLGGGDECTGVAYTFVSGHIDSTASRVRHLIGAGSTSWTMPTAKTTATNSTVLRSERVWIPAMAEADRSAYLIRVMQEMLLDVRYNPFRGEADDNYKSDYERLQETAAFVFIPARITLWSDKTGGTALYHYNNLAVASGASVGKLSYALGTWTAGAAPVENDCWLEWYDADDLRDDTGVGGWQGNRHCIGRPDGRGDRRSATIYESFKSMDNGEYLPYPPTGGWLEVVIFAGVLMYDYSSKSESDTFGTMASDNSFSKYHASRIRWLLYKAPQVTVVSNTITFDDAEIDDVTHSGELNAYAADGIELDTVCGTADGTCPTARGIYVETATGLQLTELTRAGRTASPEQLLIGTLYSQFAERKTKLTGEMELTTGTGLTLYTERNQDDRLFLMTSAEVDAIAEVAEVTLVEVVEDSYTNDDNS